MTPSRHGMVAMEQGNVIEIRGLRKSFMVRSDRGGGLFRQSEVKTVIDGIDLDIRSGETLGIIGSNGAGKSTLLRILSGILEPDEGGRIGTPPHGGAPF